MNIFYSVILPLIVLICLASIVVVHDSYWKESSGIRYLIFREDCYESFFSTDEEDSSGSISGSADTSCIKFSLSKLVGLLIVIGSCFLKLPQIIKILEAGSSEGISASSYYFSSLILLNTASYSQHLALSMSVYGEAVSILI